MECSSKSISKPINRIANRDSLILFLLIFFSFSLLSCSSIKQHAASPLWYQPNWMLKHNSVFDDFFFISFSMRFLFYVCKLAFDIYCMIVHVSTILNSNGYYWKRTLFWLQCKTNRNTIIWTLHGVYVKISKNVMVLLKKEKTNKERGRKNSF